MSIQEINFMHSDPNMTLGLVFVALLFFSAGLCSASKINYGSKAALLLQNYRKFSSQEQLCSSRLILNDSLASIALIVQNLGTLSAVQYSVSINIDENDWLRFFLVFVKAELNCLNERDSIISISSVAEELDKILILKGDYHESLAKLCGLLPASVLLIIN